MVQLGIDTLLDQGVDALTDLNLGLIANHSGVNRDFQLTIDLLHNHNSFNLKTLFAPEHGIRGNAGPGEELASGRDKQTGLPIQNLYGQGSGIKLQPEMIEDLDAVVFDVQDVGSRYYTIIYTLAFALEGTSEADKKICVLDRPNPIAPLGVSGNRFPDEYANFTGGYQLPNTHGMTVGELAQYFNGEFDIGADLSVIEMKGWERDVWYTEAEISWVYPSKNMPTINTAVIYPGTCFFEKVNISEGKGTPRPFELIGAPWINANEWAASLEQEDLPGVRFRPASFKPRRPSSKYAMYDGERIQGVQVNVFDREVVDPVRTGLTLLLSAFSIYPECECRNFGGDYIIDSLAGGDYLRKILSEIDSKRDVTAVVDSLMNQWEDDVAEFLDVREEYLLY